MIFIVRKKQIYRQKNPTMAAEKIHQNLNVSEDFTTGPNGMSDSVLRSVTFVSLPIPPEISSHIVLRTYALLQSILMQLVLSVVLLNGNSYGNNKKGASEQRNSSYLETKQEERVER